MCSQSVKELIKPPLRKASAKVATFQITAKCFENFFKKIKKKEKNKGIERRERQKKGEKKEKTGARGGKSARKGKRGIPAERKAKKQRHEGNRAQQ